jgi:hypothetical protein
MSSSNKRISAALAGAALALSGMHASAAPYVSVQSVAAPSSYAATGNAPVHEVQWRGGGWRGGGFRGGGWRGGRGIGLGIGAGILGGALLGNALAASYYDRSYSYYPSYSNYPNTRYYAAPAYQSYGNADGYCAGRFRSYDPASGTYLGYDGYRHPCP